MCGASFYVRPFPFRSDNSSGCSIHLEKKRKLLGLDILDVVYGCIVRFGTQEENEHAKQTNKKKKQTKLWSLRTKKKENEKDKGKRETEKEKCNKSRKKVILLSRIFVVNKLESFHSKYERRKRKPV